MPYSVLAFCSATTEDHRFQKFVKPQYPRRQWLIEGEPDTGKSTFITQMKKPILPIDADQRFAEVVHLADQVYQLSHNPADNISVDRIAEILYEQMPGSDVGTIAVDSLTTIFVPLVMQAVRACQRQCDTIHHPFVLNFTFTLD